MAHAVVVRAAFLTTESLKDDVEALARVPLRYRSSAAQRLVPQQPPATKQKLPQTAMTESIQPIRNLLSGLALVTALAFVSPTLGALIVTTSNENGGAPSGPFTPSWVVNTNDSL